MPRITRTPSVECPDRRSGKRYDGHPDLNDVDISTVGYWGEGMGAGPAGWTIQQQLIDLYFKAFPRTPLLMNFDELTR